jgi:hypothetical protein
MDGQTHHSLAMKYALRRFRALGGSRVLDLGPALGRNVQFLSPFISKLFIADLHATLRSQSGRSSLDRARFSKVLKSDFPATDQRPVDLVLVWDLLNYLDREQVTTLGQHLARLCRRDSLLFVMLSTLQTIPELPGRYLMLDPETLRCENDSKRERRASGYKEPDLEKLMPAFEVETSYLLRSGIQEYVLTPRSAA